MPAGATTQSALSPAEQRQRHVAARAAPRVAAVPADEVAGVASPVMEEDRLLAGVDRLGERGGELRREDVVHVAHVDDLEGWRSRAVDPRREVGVQRRSRVGLDARRRRPADDDGPARLRPPAGHRAGVVVRLVVLLVGGVVLLVDDDQAEVLERSEDRRPRAHGEAHAARGELPVGVEPLACRKAGVEDGHRLAGEALTHPADGLPREADLRHQEEHRAPRSADGRGGAQVDLGLAAAGDPVQQHLVAGAGGAEDRVEGRRLVGQQIDLIAQARAGSEPRGLGGGGPGSRRLRRRLARRPPFLPGHHAHRARGHEALEADAREAGRGAQSARVDPAHFGERLERGTLTGARSLDLALAQRPACGTRPARRRRGPGARRAPSPCGGSAPPLAARPLPAASAHRWPRGRLRPPRAPLCPRRSGRTDE